MKPYKRLTIICSSISLFSFIACLCLHYLIVCDDTDFWVNVCLAIFGSSLLTVHEILQELNGKYYDIMYGKKKSHSPKVAGKNGDKH